MPPSVARLIEDVQALEVVALGGTGAVCDDVLQRAAAFGAIAPVELTVDNAVDRSSCWSDRAPYEIDAVTYATGLAHGRRRPVLELPSEDGSIQDDLGRDYTRLLATFGISDASPIDNEWQFDVFLDGVQVLSERVGFGEAVDIGLDVTNALRLRIDATFVGGDDPVGIVIGNPRVLSASARDSARDEPYRSAPPAQEYFLTDYGQDCQVRRDTTSCWGDSAGFRMGGEAYARPRHFGDRDPYWSCGSCTGTIGYDLERAFTRFVEFDVDVTGVLRLKLVVVVGPSGVDGVHAGFGDPKLVK